MIKFEIIGAVIGFILLFHILFLLSHCGLLVLTLNAGRNSEEKLCTDKKPK